jgi:hypothetical protein
MDEIVDERDALIKIHALADAWLHCACQGAREVCIDRIAIIEEAARRQIGTPEPEEIWWWPGSIN